jgi:hypothetical protein
MRKIAGSFLLMIIASVSVNSKNIKTEMMSNYLVKAVIDKDVAFISKAFAPKIFFQYVLVKEFGNKEYAEFINSKGVLHDIFFNSTYFQKNMNSNIKCLRDVFANAGQCTINTQQDDSGYLSSITVYYNNCFYDILLNCNNENECEISGINITPASGMNDLIFSSVSANKMNYQKLTKKINLEKSREMFYNGIPQLSLNKKQSENIYGPNKKFKVIKAGMENGYGGVVYVLADGSIILFQHLTDMSQSIVDGSKNDSSFDPGTFIGGSNKLIGIADENKSTYVTVQGRSIAGSIMTIQEVIRVLTGK